MVDIAVKKDLTRLSETRVVKCELPAHVVFEMLKTAGITLDEADNEATNWAVNLEKVRDSGEWSVVIRSTTKEKKHMRSSLTGLPIYPEAVKPEGED